MKKVAIFILKKFLVLAIAVVLTIGVSVIAFAETDKTYWKFLDTYQIAGSEHSLSTEVTEYTFKPKATTDFSVYSVESAGIAYWRANRKLFLSFYTVSSEKSFSIKTGTEGKVWSGTVYGDLDGAASYAFSVDADGTNLNMYIDSIYIHVYEMQ